MTSAPKPHARIKILVVEDSRTQAERLRHMLEQHDYEVTVAGNGQLALDAIEASLPDLVISDINMPVMDGYELSKKLKATSGLRELPVILVTTMSDPEDVIRGLECGADNFVLKPFEDAYLLGRIRYALANREIARSDDSAMGATIFFNGRKHFITADRLQIINLLLSTYEAAIQRNRELLESQNALEKRSSEMAFVNRFLDEVIENIPHMIFVKDAANLRYVRVNRALEELVGLSRDQLIGKSDPEVFSQDAARFTEKDREVLATGRSEAFNEPIHTVRNGVRIVHTRKMAIADSYGRPQFLLGIAEDVTELKAREEEILRLNAALKQRTAEADAASRAKSTFLATMSHEIRTPMNGMLGMLEILSLSPLDEDQRATLEVIRESSASLLRIVDDVLDFSKIEAGQLEICPEPTSIQRLLAEVERTYASAATRKGLTVDVAMDPAISSALLVDGLRLRQILGNFVSNSIKFTATGSIQLAAQLAERHDGVEHVRFEVRDTGIGISEANQKRLFEPFSQGDAEAARRAGGTGLGLSICRRLAEMMGGGVEMQSEIGAGTTMSLTLPLAVASHGGAPHVVSEELRGSASSASLRRHAPEISDARRDGALVLVVDDHPTNRMLLVRQLNMIGYAAESAEDGASALALWKSGKYGAVLTDCEMPGMSGYELASRIRAIEVENARGRTPVLACTAHALVGELEKCLEAGMDDCLAKPIGLVGLQGALQKWLPLTAESTDPAGESDAQRKPLDASLIAATWGDAPGTVSEILDFFQRANNEDAVMLHQAVNARDVAQITRATHRMLGASRMVGAQQFASVCERLNRASREGNWEAIVAGMAEFESELERLNSFIAATSADVGKLANATPAGPVSAGSAGAS